MIQNIKSDKQYLSEIYTELPTNCILNKGVTGCGGTYVELHSNRDSIILVPTIELAKNKKEDGFLIVYGKVLDKDIEKYINSNLKNKKIIGTYDCLPRLLKYDVTNYFLLIDEYHLLFNSYSFRNDAILFLLKNYTKFKDFCFMTATPLSKDIILDEIKYLKQINISWSNSIPIKLNILNTPFTNKELCIKLRSEENCNYHIFLNSLKTIRDLVNKLKLEDYRVICSETARRNNKKLKVRSTTDPVCKYNFYTAAAFEGCDVYDPIGKTIILCDTNISTTILDISTLIRQICGRLRDSIYKEEITLVLNTHRHRYVNVNKFDFKNTMSKNIELGKAMESGFILADDIFKKSLLTTYSSEIYYSIYVNKYVDTIFYDDNLRKMDEYNYKLIGEIYKDSISVLKECVKNNFKTSQKKSELNILEEVRSTINYNFEYAFEDLRILLLPLFEKYDVTFNYSTLQQYLPPFEKKRKTKHKIKSTYYKFIV